MSAVFTLVRAQAKLEKPLVTLAGGNGGALIISTIADVTFFGKDQTGRDVTVTGSISINFADWADPELARCSHDERTTTSHFCCWHWPSVWATTACTSKPDIPKATGPSELGLSLQVTRLARRAHHRWPVAVADHHHRARARTASPRRAFRCGPTSGSAGRSSTTARCRPRAARPVPMAARRSPTRRRRAALPGNPDFNNIIQVAFTPLSGDYANCRGARRQHPARPARNDRVTRASRLPTSRGVRHTPFEMDEVTLDAGLSRDCPADATSSRTARPTALADAPGSPTSGTWTTAASSSPGASSSTSSRGVATTQVKLTVINARGVTVRRDTEAIDVLARP